MSAPIVLTKFETGTNKLNITLERWEHSDGSELIVRVGDRVGNFTTFKVDDEASGRMSARFLADKVLALL